MVTFSIRSHADTTCVRVPQSSAIVPVPESPEEGTDWPEIDARDQYFFSCLLNLLLSHSSAGSGQKLQSIPHMETECPM